MRDVVKLQVQEDLAATLLNRLHRPRALGCKELDPHLEQRDRGAKLVHELCGSGKVLDVQGHDQSGFLMHDIAPYLKLIGASDLPPRSARRQKPSCKG